MNKVKPVTTYGYSGKSLTEKLGIKESFTVIFINPPEKYEELLGKLPPNVIDNKRLTGKFDLIHFFTKDKKELKLKFSILKKHLKPNGSLWISWPKKASGLKTDLAENDIIKIGLENGLVDVKVCAVDDLWSGLKFVFRLRDRK